MDTLQGKEKVRKGLTFQNSDYCEQDVSKVTKYSKIIACPRVHC